jgi:hypothetical protein
VVLEGLVHLANFLISQTDIIENPEEEDKKRSLVFNKIPHEIVKDPSGLARELLWRVKRELGHKVRPSRLSLNRNHGKIYGNRQPRESSILIQCKLALSFLHGDHS